MQNQLKKVKFYKNIKKVKRKNNNNNLKKVQVKTLVKIYEYNKKGI